MKQGCKNTLTFLSPKHPITASKPTIYNLKSLAIIKIYEEININFAKPSCNFHGYCGTYVFATLHETKQNCV
jgi:hypothetical protein